MARFNYGCLSPLPTPHSALPTPHSYNLDLYLNLEGVGVDSFKREGVDTLEGERVDTLEGEGVDTL